jgi:uncharacterized protein (DUF58 family)
VLLFAAGTAVAVLPAVVSERLWLFWLLWLGASLVLLGADTVLGIAARRVTARVDVPEYLYVGEPGAMRVDLEAGGQGLRALVECVVDLDPALVATAPAPVALPGGGAARIPIPLVARRRGVLAVEAVWLRWTGPLGLMRRVLFVPVGREVRVGPDIGAVRSQILRFFGSREAIAGPKVERYAGDGTEFKSLREWFPGLDPRAIHWKASARHRRLLGQEFQAERNHTIVLAFDTGHLMSEPLEGMPRLDHAIHAGLLMGYAALRAGDRVGLFAFDERVRAWSEPSGGLGAFARLRTAASDLRYGTGETNFTLGLAELSARLGRRALIVLFTDFVDVVTADLMAQGLARLSTRHLVAFLTLRDPWLDQVADAPPRSLTDLHRAVVAGDFVREREVVLRRLRRQGVQPVDAPPSSVSVRLLNRYLDIKRRELV